MSQKLSFFAYAVALAIQVAFITQVKADECTWTGDRHNDWNDDANWSCQHVPTENDAVIIKGLAEGRTAAMFADPDDDTKPKPSRTFASLTLNSAEGEAVFILHENLRNIEIKVGSITVPPSNYISKISLPPNARIKVSPTSTSSSSSLIESRLEVTGELELHTGSTTCQDLGRLYINNGYEKSNGEFEEVLSSITIGKGSTLKITSYDYSPLSQAADANCLLNTEGKYQHAWTGIRNYGEITLYIPEERYNPICFAGLRNEIGSKLKIDDYYGTNGVDIILKDSQTEGSEFLFTNGGHLQFLGTNTVDLSTLFTDITVESVSHKSRVTVDGILEFTNIPNLAPQNKPISIDYLYFPKSDSETETQIIGCQNITVTQEASINNPLTLGSTSETYDCGPTITLAKPSAGANAHQLQSRFKLLQGEFLLEEGATLNATTDAQIESQYNQVATIRGTLHISELSQDNEWTFVNHGSIIDETTAQTITFSIPKGATSEQFAWTGDLNTKIKLHEDQLIPSVILKDLQFGGLLDFSEDTITRHIADSQERETLKAQILLQNVTLDGATLDGEGIYQQKGMLSNTGNSILSNLILVPQDGEAQSGEDDVPSMHGSGTLTITQSAVLNQNYDISGLRSNQQENFELIFGPEASVSLTSQLMLSAQAMITNQGQLTCTDQSIITCPFSSNYETTKGRIYNKGDMVIHGTGEGVWFVKNAGKLTVHLLDESQQTLTDKTVQFHGYKLLNQLPDPPGEQETTPINEEYVGGELLIATPLEIVHTSASCDQFGGTVALLGSSLKLTTPPDYPHLVYPFTGTKLIGQGTLIGDIRFQNKSTIDLANLTPENPQVALSNKTGALTVNGNFLLDDTSTWHVDVANNSGSSSSGSFDHMSIAGEAQFLGRIETSFAANPSLTDSYTLATTSRSLVCGTEPAYSARFNKLPSENLCYLASDGITGSDHDYKYLLERANAASSEGDFKNLKLAISADYRRPMISAIHWEAPADGKPYKIGSDIRFSLQFDEGVTSRNSTSTAASLNATLNIARGSSTTPITIKVPLTNNFTTLTGTYSVESGDHLVGSEDVVNSLYDVKIDKLEFESANTTIQDATNNEAYLDILPPQTGAKCDATYPFVQKIQIIGYETENQLCRNRELTVSSFDNSLSPIVPTICVYVAFNEPIQISKSLKAVFNNDQICRLTPADESEECGFSKIYPTTNLNTAQLAERALLKQHYLSCKTNFFKTSSSVNNEICDSTYEPQPLKLAKLVQDFTDSPLYDEANNKGQFSSSLSLPENIAQTLTQCELDRSEGALYAESCSILIDQTAPQFEAISLADAEGDHEGAYLYGIGKPIRFNLEFSEAVSPNAASITYRLSNGDERTYSFEDSTHYQKSLQFIYEVPEGTSYSQNNLDVLEISLSGKIADRVGNLYKNPQGGVTPTGSSALIAHHIQAAIDAVKPQLESITTSYEFEGIGANQKLPLSFHFSEEVTITGNVIAVFDNSRYLPLRLIEMDEKTLTYEATIPAEWPTGVLAIAKLRIENADEPASVIDAAGNPLNGITLDTTGLELAFQTTITTPNNREISVDTNAPSIQKISATPLSATAQSPFKKDEELKIAVEFSEPDLVLTGDLSLTLQCKSRDEASEPANRVLKLAADSEATSATNRATFSQIYTVSDGETCERLQVVSLAGNLRDMGGNQALLDLTQYNSIQGLQVETDKTYYLLVKTDGQAPAISSLTTTNPNQSFGAGSSIRLILTFDESVLLTGDLNLELSTGAIVAFKASGDQATKEFTANYVVGSNHNDPQLTAKSLKLAADASLVDLAGNPANLAIPGSANLSDQNINVDTTAPYITHITGEADESPVTSGGIVDITVHFNEPVTLTGTLIATFNMDNAQARIDHFDSKDSATFSYIVQPGNFADPLDLIGLNANTKSTTLKDQAGNDAIVNEVVEIPSKAKLSLSSKITVDAPNSNYVDADVLPDSYGTETNCDCSTGRKSDHPALPVFLFFAALACGRRLCRRRASAER